MGLNETDDIKFEELLLDKRHKEFMNLLRSVLNELKQTKDENIINALNKQLEALGKLEREVKNHSPKTPDNSYKELVAMVKEMRSDFRNGIEDLIRIVSVKKEWVLKVKTDSYTGAIEEVYAKQIK